MYFLVLFAKCNYSYHVLSIKFVRSIWCHALGSVLHSLCSAVHESKAKINETVKSHSVFLQFRRANTSLFDRIGFCDRVVCASIFRRLKRNSGIEDTTCISNRCTYTYSNIPILFFQGANSNIPFKIHFSIVNIVIIKSSFDVIESINSMSTALNGRWEN